VSYLKRVVVAAASMAPAGVLAHVPAAPDVSREEAPWIVSALLFTSALLYAHGFLKLWPRVHALGELLWRAVAFAAGWCALVLALLSPLDVAAGSSFAYHMVQHEILMLVAAPLLVVGRALPMFIWAFPARVRVATGRTTRIPALRSSWSALTSPLGAWILHAAALWLWHVPAIFNAAVVNSTVHEWQHATFLVTALIFWHALLRHGTQGVAIVYLFTTTIHTGVLGALLTLARHPLYATLDAGLYDLSGLTPLEDQQLGGLIMWVPGALVYVGVALFLLSRWLSRDPISSGASHPR
jgi:putative membrane protein